jgi:hypothetical protein
MLTYTVYDDLAQRNNRSFKNKEAAALNQYRKMRTEVLTELLTAADSPVLTDEEADILRRNIFTLNSELKSIEKILREYDIE